MAGADRRAARDARQRLLPQGRLAGPMPWVIAIMMFLTVLAAAAGLALGAAVRAMGADLAERATVQIVEADAEKRAALAQKIAASLRASPDVAAVRPVAAEKLAEQLQPWLGEDAADADLPIPALIDVDVAAGDQAARIGRIRQSLTALDKAVRVDGHAAYLEPLTALMAGLGWLAAGLVALMAIATAAIVVLAARGAHDSHRATIEVLHLMGATDVQIARLFQRRIALDAAFGGALGFAGAAAVLAALGGRLMATGSDLLTAIGLPWTAWLTLLALPVGGVILATVTARWTVLRALGRAL